MAEITSPKISIIVPVYKVEQYLRRCLDSILAQTFTDWECILIDDGSPDKSGAICDEYASRDSRFCVIHQENKGVSAARNAGLDAARGQWIGFVDSDDWCEKEMYEHLYSSALNQDVDVVICGIVGQSVEKNILLNSFDAKKNLFSLRKSFGGYSFLRLVRQKCIGNIRFDESISFLEDIKFFYGVFSVAHKILWTDEPLYNYFRNLDSVTVQIGLTEQAKSALACLQLLYNKEQNLVLRQCIKAFRLNFIFSRCLQYVMVKKTNCMEYKTLIKELKAHFFFILLSPCYRLKRKIIILTFCILKGSFLEKNNLIYKHFSNSGMFKPLIKNGKEE